MLTVPADVVPEPDASSTCPPVASLVDPALMVIPCALFVSVGPENTEIEPARPPVAAPVASTTPPLPPQNVEPVLSTTAPLTPLDAAASPVEIVMKPVLDDVLPPAPVVRNMEPPFTPPTPADSTTLPPVDATVVSPDPADSSTEPPNFEAARVAPARSTTAPPFRA